MTTSVGIVLERNYVAAVRLEGSAKHPQLHAFHAEPIAAKPSSNGNSDGQGSSGDDEPVNLYAYRAEQLDDFIRRHKLPRNASYVAPAAEFSLLRQFTVPFTADEQIRKTIMFETEAHLHSVDIDDVQIQHRKLAEIGSRSEVLVTALRKDALQETLSSLHRVGIDPIGVDTPAGGATNAALNHPAAASETPTMFLDIGVDTTTLIIAQAGALRTVRTFKLGVGLPSPIPEGARAALQDIPPGTVYDSSDGGEMLLPLFDVRAPGVAAGDTPGDTAGAADQVGQQTATGTAMARARARLLERAAGGAAAAAVGDSDPLGEAIRSVDGAGTVGALDGAVAGSKGSDASKQGGAAEGRGGSDGTQPGDADGRTGRRQAAADGARTRVVQGTAITFLEAAQASPSTVAAPDAVAGATPGKGTSDANDGLLPDARAAWAPPAADALHSTMVVSPSMILARPDTLVRRLILEVRRTLAALDASLAPSTIVLSGGGAARGVLRDALAAEFQELEVTTDDDLLGVADKSKSGNVADTSQAMLVPLGLALRGLGVEHSAAEFRRGEFAAADAFEEIKTPLAICVALLAFLFLAIFAFVLRNKEQVTALETELHDSIAGSYKAAYRPVTGTGAPKELRDEYKTPPDDSDDIFRVMYDDLAALDLTRGAPQFHGAAEVWEAIHQAYQAIPNRPYEMSMSEVEVRAGGMRFQIKGFCTGVSELDQFIIQLEESDFLENAARKPLESAGGERRNRDPRPAYTIDGDIREIRS